MSDRGPGDSDAVVAGRGGGELRRRQNCGGEVLHVRCFEG